MALKRPGSGAESGSGFTINAGAGSGFSESGSETLLSLPSSLSYSYLIAFRCQWDIFTGKRRRIV
jgi:hypothetical protein